MSELNDPRVFFAAERTLLAWNRAALSLMGRTVLATPPHASSMPA